MKELEEQWDIGRGMRDEGGGIRFAYGWAIRSQMDCV